MDSLYRIRSKVHGTGDGGGDCDGDSDGGDCGDGDDGGEADCRDSTGKPWEIFGCGAQWWT